MELVKEVASKRPESQKDIAIRAAEKSYNYLQLVSSARRISNLLNNLDSKIGNGIKRNVDLDGARVGIVAKPCAEFVAGILGTWLTGGVAVPLALSYPETELLPVLNDSDISIILSTEEHHELMNTVAVKTGACLSLLPPIPDVHSSIKHDHAKDVVSDCPRDFPEMRNCGENPALILYTSGTTGKPKGVVHTHKGTLAQVQMVAEACGNTHPRTHFFTVCHFIMCMGSSMLYLPHFMPVPRSISFQNSVLEGFGRDGVNLILQMELKRIMP